MNEEATTCKLCNRAVYVEHVNEAGLCVLCEKAPHKPTEPEWVDLGRPEDKKK